MQTFLPYSDYAECAKVLDQKRLGKQRIECKQINMALRGLYSRGWIHHPAVLMWKNYEVALCEYSIAICNEWRARGYADSQLGYFLEEIQFWQKSRTSDSLTPFWLGDERLHMSHRGNLLRKDFPYYSKYGWKESPDIPYFWPTK